MLYEAEAKVSRFLSGPSEYCQDNNQPSTLAGYDALARFLALPCTNIVPNPLIKTTMGSNPREPKVAPGLWLVSGS